MKQEIEKLEKEEILRQIDVLEQMGMGGYFCHSRTGLITEYLGDEWFDLINASADKGKEKGMETWLYDEDRWPSGTAGGKVTEKPEYRMHYLRCTVIPAAEFVWKEEWMAAFSVNLDGLNFTDKHRLAPGDNIQGNHVLAFSVEEMGPSSFYNGTTYVDTMNKEAIQYFIDLTHEKYAQKCGDRMGDSIKGIFTDEPHRGSVMCGFSVDNDSSLWITPITPALIPAIKEHYGYDLTDYLPELFLRKDGEKIHPVKWQYMETLQQLFLDAFAKPIGKWCRDHNILLTGHVLHEDTLTTQACMQGSLMRFYEYMDYPGVDLLTEHNYAYWVVKQLASTARQTGKKWMLSELYGCTGWQMNFESHKAVGDWQALLGINLRCQHLSWYSMQGEAKRDYPASILHQSAWYKEYHYVEDYFSRLHVVLAQGAPQCELLVLNPVESTWCHIYPGWSKGLATSDPDNAHIEKIYADLFHYLCGNRVDFDYGDEEMLSRLYSIEKTPDGAVLHVGEASYKTVLAAGMLTIRSSTLNILKEFMAAGGKVVFAGELPGYVDAVKSSAAAELPTIKVPFEEGAILAQVAPQHLVKVSDAEGRNIPDVYCQVRRDGEETYVVLMNLNRQHGYKGARIEMEGGCYLEEYHCQDGSISSLGHFDEDILLVEDFVPLTEKVYHLTQKDNGRPIQKVLHTVAKLPAGNTFSYRLTEDNVCVLDWASYRLNDGVMSEPTEILKVDQAVRDAVGLAHRGGEMIQPWFAGKQVLEEKGRLTMEFGFEAEVLPEGCCLVMETPEYFTVTLNGNPVTFSEDWWVDKCMKKAPLSNGLLQKGHNVVTVSCNFRDDINLEALYLIGPFGVNLEGLTRTLTALPESLAIGDISVQGLPFYSAGVEYTLEHLPKLEEGQRLFLKLSKMDAACVKVSANGKEKMIAWQPYEADITDLLSDGAQQVTVTYVLTRRNTFGPLHLNPPVISGYGPDAFLTTGDRFMWDRYSLLPDGMTEALSFEVKA